MVPSKNLRQSRTAKSKKMKASRVHQDSVFKDLENEREVLGERIHFFETFISEIQNRTGCRSTSEIRELFSNLDESNQTLYEGILSINE